MKILTGSWKDYYYRYISDISDVPNSSKNKYVYQMASTATGATWYPKATPVHSIAYDYVTGAWSDFGNDIPISVAFTDSTVTITFGGNTTPSTFTNPY